ncbi:MAG: hypothetical protein IPJ20_00680 [Flammeovirgaceae bacterium]|nr:hypothetical protein [Flammeovirgaceae bacterium]
MNLALYIEHTNLSPLVNGHAIDQWVGEAKEHGFLGANVFEAEANRISTSSGISIIITQNNYPHG